MGAKPVPAADEVACPSSVLVFGLNVVDFGNSCKKSVSPGQLRRNPIELRSDAAVSGVDGTVAAASGLGADA